MPRPSSDGVEFGYSTTENWALPTAKIMVVQENRLEPHVCVSVFVVVQENTDHTSLLYNEIMFFISDTMVVVPSLLS